MMLSDPHSPQRFLLDVETISQFLQKIAFSSGIHTRPGSGRIICTLRMAPPDSSRGEPFAAGLNQSFFDYESEAPPLPDSFSRSRSNDR